MKPRNDPAQLAFPALFCPVKIVQTGVDSFRVEVGNPLQWLKPIQVATEIGVNRESVYRWIAEATLPERIRGEDGKEIVLWELEGRRRYRINALAVGWLKAKFHHEKQALNGALTGA